MSEAPDIEDEFEDEADAPEGDDGSEFEPEITIEDRARAMGWHPLPADPRNPQPHEYRGDPRRHVGAEEFVAKAEREVPVMRDQNRRLQEKVTRMGGQIDTLVNTAAEQAAAIKDLRNLAHRSNEQGYQRGLRDLKAQQREAVAVGDTVAYDQISEQIEELTSARAETPAAVEPKPAPAPTAQSREIDEFIAENPWFNTNQTLRNAMVAAHNLVMAAKPMMPLADQLEEARQDLARRFPSATELQDIEYEDDMPTPRAPAPRPAARAAAVARPSAPQPARQRQTSEFDRIPDAAERRDARAAFERIKRHQPEMTEREYVDLYIDPHADIIELRRQSAGKK